MQIKQGVTAVKQILRECNVFQGLTDEELESIQSLTKNKEYDAGAVIFQQGDRAEELFVLQEGKIALQTQLSVPLPQMTRSVTVDILARGDVLGWSAIVEPHRYTLTAVCLQAVKVLAINGLSFRSLLQQNHDTGYEVLNGLIKVVSTRLDETRRLLVSERLSPARP